MTADPAEFDAKDPLAKFAAEFYKLPGQIYLDGNSLGLLSWSATLTLNEAIESWRNRAILGWTEGPEPWFDMSRRVAELLAPILGAESTDVMVGQSTTVNLHQILATFHQPGTKILIDEWCFPSDRYAIESHLPLRYQDPSTDLIVVPDRGGLVDEADLLLAMDASVGMAILPSVAYRTGQLLDLATLTGEARKRSVLIAWDCSHSAGVVPHEFRADDIDLAFGCTYKFLNGGPGSPGWMFVHQRLQDWVPGLAGWFGSDPVRQFQMGPTFHPALNAGRFMIGTPHVLSMAPLLGSLDLINRAGVEALRQRSLELTQRLLDRSEIQLQGLGFSLATPVDASRRGGHVTFVHEEAGAISRTMRKRGVIPDFRPPNLLRLAPAPLYTTADECSIALNVLNTIVRTGAHRETADDSPLVT
jgi:kynureninase